MVITLVPEASKSKIDKLKRKLEALGCTVQMIKGETQTIIGLVGDTTRVSPGLIQADEIVEKVIRVQEPFKRANRLFHPVNTVVEFENTSIGGNKIAIIAGPCSVESEEQIIGIAQKVKESGATFLRGGAYKPRTSPYSFQGLQDEGLRLLAIAKKETGLPIVTEVMSAKQLDKVCNIADVIQVGARNMQNFELLKEVGRIDKPVLLKRGLCNTIQELLMSAEYIMSEGNEKVILCERGIRTFETYTRNTLDISAIPLIKKLSHLPVIVDPSHAAGIAWMVEPLSMAAIAAGADGLIIEVHNDPANALCDGEQSIKPEKFHSIVRSLKKIAKIYNRCI